ncbi:gamma-glutamylcyclotransferase family protein [Aspergillus ibericus CBS 121593]|uniref:Putative gamma-glutamylcyclotransferase n=1 Tax=Aspergillus ibericus CBS 121593 TaxID=1448316 RepID=A0A395H6M6_9EURO|nr:hypothetical protein BO80DRAFT_470824 [Aspergillus ibericus CBS 121593]RAL03173.1 hypothetical protein BO80DRAFT_470824 [Aspergillus ibericus CBS 121593]
MVLEVMLFQKDGRKVQQESARSPTINISGALADCSYPDKQLSYQNAYFLELPPTKSSREILCSSLPGSKAQTLSHPRTGSKASTNLRTPLAGIYLPGVYTGVKNGRMASLATNRQTSSLPQISAATTQEEPANTHQRPDLFQTRCFFFYGSLGDPTILTKVLRLRDRPALRPATIMEHGMKLWGEYPALLDGRPEIPIHGVAYEVRSQEDEDRLVEYETDMYRKKGCLIEFRDGSKVPGVTFVWNADPGLLRDGGSELKDWLFDQRDIGES